jgi:hypothetical protein
MHLFHVAYIDANIIVSKVIKPQLIFIKRNYCGVPKNIIGKAKTIVQSRTTFNIS